MSVGTGGLSTWSTFELAGYSLPQSIKLEEAYQKLKDFGVTRGQIINVLRSTNNESNRLSKQNEQQS